MSLKENKMSLSCYTRRKNDLKSYQENSRFYLDEFPEQKKLREEYFSLKRASYNFTVNNTENYWFESKFLIRR